jgi:dTMP kinase
MLITLEGGEVVGKTTQMNLLKEHLSYRWPERTGFVFTLEPGGTDFARNIRELILSDKAKEADGMTMFGLFAAARADHVRRVIQPALERKETVVCDRYVAATFAYQVRAMQPPMSEWLFWEYFKTIPKPDLTIILDMDPRVSQERLRSRSGQAATHFDTRPLDFHDRLRAAYRHWRDLFPLQTVIVDANQSIEKVHGAIMAHIGTLFIKAYVE